MTSAPPVVVVTFYSRCGTTESLALAAAVGAVQARANIRLRRLADADGAAPTAEASPECREALARMHREYVPPAAADLAAADALVVAPPAGASTHSPEWRPFFDILAGLRREGRLGGKVAAVVETGNEQTVAAFADALRQSGLTIVSADGPAAGGTPRDGQARATQHGRSLAEAARALRQSGTT